MVEVLGAGRVRRALKVIAKADINADVTKRADALYGSLSTTKATPAKATKTTAKERRAMAKAAA